MKKRGQLKKWFASLTVFVLGVILSGAIASASTDTITAVKEAEEAVVNVAVTEAEENTEVVITGAVSEKDEAAILKLVQSYSKRKTAGIETLETMIDNYFIAEYGTVRAFYIVEFKASTGGTIEGRTVYVLMNGEETKYLKDATGGFVVPSTVSRSEYAFDYWYRSGEGEELSGDRLESLPITASTVIYAKFAADKNGDSVPDYKQPQYNVEFVADPTYGVLSDRTSFLVYAPINGNPAYLDNAINFNFPAVHPNKGYAFDKWADSEGKEVDLKTYIVDGNKTIHAVFAGDKNYDGIPDYKQKFYCVDFAYTSGGTLKAENLIFYVLIKEDGKPSYLYENQDYYDIQAVANEGYMFLHWVDHTGKVISEQEDAKELIHTYPITDETVIVAVFTEDKNNDGIPDSQQEFFQVDFVAGTGGYVEGGSKVFATGMNGEYPVIGQSNFSFYAKAYEGYALSYWVRHDGKIFDGDGEWIEKYIVSENTVFVAVFEEDLDGNGVPDRLQPKSYITFEVENPRYGKLGGKTEFVYFWDTGNENLPALSHSVGGFEMPDVSPVSGYTATWYVKDNMVAEKDLPFTKFPGPNTSMVITCKFVAE